MTWDTQRNPITKITQILMRLVRPVVHPFRIAQATMFATSSTPLLSVYPRMKREITNRVTFPFVMFFISCFRLKTLVPSLHNPLRTLVPRDEVFFEASRVGLHYAFRTFVPSWLPSKVFSVTLHPTEPRNPVAVTNKFLMTLLASCKHMALIVAFLFLLVPSSAEAIWFDTNFTYCREFQMTAGGNVGGAATTTTLGMPLVATTTLSDLSATSSGGKIQKLDATGEYPLDLIFVSGDDCNSNSGSLLDFDIEEWTTTTGAIVAWVEHTDVSSTTGKSMLMYYGNPTATDQRDESGVWDGVTDYAAVYNLDELFLNVTGVALDATANNNDLTESGTVDRLGEVAGYLNGGVDWDQSAGSDQIQRTGGTYTTVGDNFSVSIWVKISSGLERSVMHWGQTAITAGNWGISLGPTTQLIFCASADGGTALCTNYTATYDAGSGDISDDKWHHVFLRRDKAGGTVDWVIDGVNRYTTTSVTTAQLDNAQAVAVGGVGKMRNTSSYYFGQMDQFQLAGSYLDIMDNLTLYNNQSNSAVFWSIGAEETEAAAATSTDQGIIWF